MNECGTRHFIPGTGQSSPATGRADTGKKWFQRSIATATLTALMMLTVPGTASAHAHASPATDQAEDTPLPALTDEIEGDVAEVDDAAVGTVQASLADPTSSQLPVEGDFSLTPGTTSTMVIAIPDGTTPLTVRANITGTSGDLLQVNSQTRSLATIDVAQGSFEVPISAKDVNADGNLVLTFAYKGFTGTWCAIDGTQSGTTTPILITDVLVDLSGEATLPATVSDFFTGTNTAVIQIPNDASEALSFAALDLVAGVTQTLGSNSSVQLDVVGFEADPSAETAERTVPTALQRRVVLEPGSGPALTRIDRTADGVAQLTLSGGEDELLGAVAAFGTSGIALASAAETRSLDATSPVLEPTAATQTVNLNQLGINNLSISGYGSHDAYIGLSQASFGGMLEELQIHLVGAVSSSAETVGTVQLLWNSVLIDSFPVDPDESQIDRTVTIPATALRSGNALVVRLQAVNAEQVCIDERLLPQIRLDISADQSTVTSVRGDTDVATFQDFPQALGGSATLAFGTEPSAAELVSAANLVGALQRAQSPRLSISGTSAQKLIAGTSSGILIGTTPEQAQQLRTPLRFAELRRIATSGTELTVAVDQPYAALQAVRENGRSLLVLGEYSTKSESSDDALLNVTSELSDTSWLQLDGSILLASPESDPVILDVNEIIPQEEAKADYKPVAWWAIIGLAALILIGLVAAKSRSNRKKKAERTVQSEIAKRNAMLLENESDAASENVQSNEPGAAAAQPSGEQD